MVKFWVYKGARPLCGCVVGRFCRVIAVNTNGRAKTGALCLAVGLIFVVFREIKP